MQQTPQQRFAFARWLYRVSEGDPGYNFDNRLTRSGRNPIAMGHVNPTRDRATAVAAAIDQRAVSHLGRYKPSAMKSVPRAQFEWAMPVPRSGDDPMQTLADEIGRKRALRTLKSDLFNYRYGNKGLAWRFDSYGFKVLDLKAQRILAEKSSREAEARMLGMASACAMRASYLVHTMKGTA